jgi:hypothetical protein
MRQWSLTKVLLRWHQPKKGKVLLFFLEGRRKTRRSRRLRVYAAVDELGSHGGGIGLEDYLEKLGNRVSWFEIFIGKR